MAPAAIVDDASLAAVLEVSRHAREQALALADLVAAGSSSGEAAPEIAKQQKLLAADLAHLRALHRSAHFSARDTKAQTAEARQEVDRLHLLLQNLYYEQKHLQGEIQRCEDYEYVSARPASCLRGFRTYTNVSGSHKYQQLPLIPVEEFLAQHPDHVDDDENALMVARIEHERTEREALEQQRQELLKRKQKLIADNKKRKDDLASLDQDLEKFIDVSCHPHRVD
jgi:THO complex subunit 5